MSIEQDLKRIADAAEAILAVLKPIGKVEMIVDAQCIPEAPVEKVKAAVIKEEKPAAPVAPKKEKKDEKAFEPTEDDLRIAVRNYMNMAGKDAAIELLVKYGAKMEKPMIKDVTDKANLWSELSVLLKG